ncbi:translation initiation factor IF-2 [Gloeocapsa sp. PCC 73106]|uniref:translation initiation factor IF-2 n=1 Tax=Gloeocapsa sp. PCC 73106 TaxID=102232 RepID=UPI0002ACE524|nr:translation initiation factor IF-2 [Gloeocapsa sp. PCC 73106]ELR98663.1 translation initiation factor IF-2 [Gloeocapsa sp. PCC 73106]
MNHEKVRIYDLSKELDIDNKEVLEICAQLNIVVKSHSSTITESQAEQIRAKAERISQVKQSEVEQSWETITSKNKPEILAVHHKQHQDDFNPDMSPSNTVNTKPELTLTPAARPPKPQLTPTDPSTTDSSQQISTDHMLESSQLLQPPVRPEKPKPQVKPLAKKPSPKQEKNPDVPVKSKREIEKVKAPETEISISETLPTEEKAKVKVKVRPKAKSEQEPEKNQEEGSVRLPRLIRPQLPKPAKPKSTEGLDPGLDLESELGIEGAEKETDSDEAILLEKPKRNKQIKLTKPEKAKKWEEEEEEDNKAKAAKLAPKNKRRSVVIEEDEEDLDALLEAAGSSTVMNLAIARPPKPKSENPVSVTKPSQIAKLKKTGEKTEKRVENKETKVVEELPAEIELSGSLTVRSLAELLKISETEIIKNLFAKGIAVNITQTLELETATQVAQDLGVKVTSATVEAAATKTTEMLDISDLEKLVRRPPVVTIMGHVDHGKTTLLDSIRKTKVAQGEAGGITQHIGAYHVDVEHNGKNQQVVFLDTPGHEAFTAMRARGTKVTDIAVLVVAADDGVQPQTREAISHAKAAGVPLVVAINKVDKIEANPDRIKQELMELSLVPEEWGGETIMVPVSALKGENLDTLLEMILLVAEVEELSANPDRLAKGTIIEAHLDRAKGPVATLLVQNGTLKVGDIILAGSVFGRIRAMIDDRGAKVERATPSFAVEILGLNQVPAAGDEFEVFFSEKEARLMAEARGDEQRQTRLQQNLSSRRVSLTTFSEQAREGQLKELNLILKADVQGSVEAILGALQQLPQNEVQLRILLSSAGEVTETDVDLAAASGAVIIGFNTTLASGARSAADQESVDIREYNIIYKLLDDIQGAMEGLLDPEEIEEYLGTAEVRAVFTVGRGSVAGCYIQSGKVIRNRLLRVRRQEQVVFQGSVDSLKRMKEDVKEVNAGYECGIGSNKFNEWQERDVIEVYQMVMKRRTLSTN